MSNYRDDGMNENPKRCFCNSMQMYHQRPSQYHCIKYRYELTTEEVSGLWGKLHNNEIHNKYSLYVNYY
jgi:hypothetical protein